MFIALSCYRYRGENFTYTDCGYIRNETQCHFEIIDTIFMNEAVFVSAYYSDSASYNNFFLEFKNIPNITTDSFILIEEIDDKMRYYAIQHLNFVSICRNKKVTNIKCEQLALFTYLQTRQKRKLFCKDKYYKNFIKICEKRFLRMKMSSDLYNEIKHNSEDKTANLKTDILINVLMPI